MAITASQIIRAATLDSLNSQMATLIAASWQPRGPVTQDSHDYYMREMIQGTEDVAILNTLEGVTASSTELNLLDGATSANDVASKAAVLDAAGALRTAENVGAAATGVTAVEYGDGYNHVTVLTLDTTLPAIAGGAALAVGKLAYTFPAGDCVVSSSRIDAAITQSEGNITSDTPDVGLGTTIASGAVSVLDGTAAFENLITGQTATDCNGTAIVKSSAPSPGADLVIEAGDDHTVYVNAADTWAASGDAAAQLTGTVTIVWQFLGA